MRAALVAGKASHGEVLELVRAQPSMEGRGLVAGGSTASVYAVGGRAPRGAVLHLGCKRSIVARLLAAGASVRVFPHTTSADDVLSHAPDGVVVSNGPGDPAALDAETRTVGDPPGRGPPLAT